MAQYIRQNWNKPKFSAIAESPALYSLLIGWCTIERPGPPSFLMAWICMSLALGRPLHWSFWTPAKAVWVCSPSFALQGMELEVLLDS